MLIGLIVVACFLGIIALLGLSMCGARDHKIAGGHEKGHSAEPWRGIISVCCQSAFAPADIIRRTLGWRAGNYGEPVHLSWWLATTNDYYREHNYTVQQWRQPCTLKNTVEEHSLSTIADKSKMFSSMLETNPEYSEYIPASWLIDDFREHLDAEKPVKWPVILKDPEASVGLGVWVVKDRKELEDRIEAQFTLRGNPRATINEYMDDPLLWYDEPKLTETRDFQDSQNPKNPDQGSTQGGKKVNMRVYLILMVREGIVEAWVPDHIRVRTAELPYVRGEYHDRRIHVPDTEYTLREYWWERDAAWHFRKTPEELEKIYTSMLGCVRAVAHTAATQLRIYPEAPAAYQLLGVDILPDSSGKCWLIEVNERPAWVAKSYDGRNLACTSMYAKYQVENIILPYYGVDFPKKAPIGVYHSWKSGRLTPHVSAIAEGAAVREVAGRWETRGPREVCEILVDLARQARALPRGPSRPLIISQSIKWPASPPVGLTWEDIDNRRDFKKLTVVSIPGKSGIIRETLLNSWLQNSLGMTKYRGGAVTGASLIFGEPGISGYELEGTGEAALKHTLYSRGHICDSARLHATLLRYGGSEFTPRTWIFEAFTDIENIGLAFSPGDLYIVKHRGTTRGSQVVATAEDYAAAIHACRDTGGIIQEYLRYPVTSRGKKMHLRCYLAAYAVEGVTRAYYATDVHHVLVARKEYTQGSWGSREIHMSREDFTSEWLEWPVAMDGGPLEACLAQDAIHGALAALGKAACLTLTKRGDCVGAFHVFAVDLLLAYRVQPGDLAATPPEERLRAYILKVEDYPQTNLRRLNPREHDQLSWRYLTWLEQAIVGPHFCTTYGLASIACELTAGKESELSLVKYIHLLAGRYFINVKPTPTLLAPNAYDLSISNIFLGRLHPTTRGTYAHANPPLAWWSDLKKINDPEIHRCGVALINVAYMSAAYNPRISYDEEITAILHENSKDINYLRYDPSEFVQPEQFVPRTIKKKK